MHRDKSPHGDKNTGDNVLRGTAQGIALVVVCGKDGVLKTVKMRIELVPGLKRNLFSSLVAAQEGVKTIIQKNEPAVGLELFSG